jgi:hypothetical protein
MSKRIQQILEVIEETRVLFNNEDISVEEARSRAVVTVTKRHGLTRKTVPDKYERWLKPDVNDAQEFDSLLEDLLIHDSSAELRRILLKFAHGVNDVNQIEATLGRAPEKAGPEQEPYSAPADDSFEEGKLSLKLHISKERNRYLVKLAKEKWLLEQNGNIRCSVCLFSFWDTYGEIGKDFIEAHHVLPISSLTSETVVHVSDLVPVCSNCHRILHRSRPPLTVSQLQNILVKPR